MRFTALSASDIDLKLLFKAEIIPEAVKTKINFANTALKDEIKTKSKLQAFFSS